VKYIGVQDDSHLAPDELPECGVNLLHHTRPRAEVLLPELVERRLVGVEVDVEVFGVGVFAIRPLVYRARSRGQDRS